MTDTPRGLRRFPSAMPRPPCCNSGRRRPATGCGDACGWRLAEAERDLGADIPAEALAQMRAHLDDIDFPAVAAYERRFRHDVMAHVHAYGDVAPAARGVIHLGPRRRS